MRTQTEPEIAVAKKASRPSRWPLTGTGNVALVGLISLLFVLAYLLGS